MLFHYYFFDLYLTEGVAFSIVHLVLRRETFRIAIHNNTYLSYYKNTYLCIEMLA